MDSELKEILKGIKGFRDYYPEDYAEINHILGTMKNVSEEFGYEEYEGPSLEYAKLIEIKSGQELLDETFTVISKDERKLVLRPEQTPTLARMIANQHQRYIKPMRWYCLPRIFRNETPQKGRVREFFQYNADILGVDHPAADAEIIAITIKIIKETGLNSGEFICVINSRELMQSYVEYLKIPNYIKVIKIIDSRGKFLQNVIQKELVARLSDEKIAKEKALEFRTIWEQDPRLEKDYSSLRSNHVFSEYLGNLSEIEEKSVKEALRKIDLNEDQITKFYNFATQSGSPDFVINRLKTMEIGERAESALQNLEDLCKYLKLYNIFDDCEYDTSVARGLDYYTGIVYEFFDRTGSVVRSIAGGGRYDQLVSAFGGSKIPATGIGMGETVLLAILKKLGRIKEYGSLAEVYVAPINKEVITETAEIVEEIRKQFKTLFNPFGWKLSKHLEDAGNRGIPIAVIVGKRDLDENKVTLRNLKTGEKTTIVKSNLMEEIESMLTKQI